MHSDVDSAQPLLALLSGGGIGLVLGLVGGGGSILAVPLLLYIVGVGSPHMAIGTAAVAVAANALTGLMGHARAGRVKWPCAILFAICGMVGAAVGAELGKAVDGAHLLFLFGILMIIIGLSMLRAPQSPDVPSVRLSRQTARNLLPRLVPSALMVGSASGFFGIGGGFLIVPALRKATSMPMDFAIGTSLVAVSALGITTALSYARSGLVDWQLAFWLLIGGAVGSLIGVRVSAMLAGQKNMLQRIFAALVIGVGGYIFLRGL